MSISANLKNKKVLVTGGAAGIGLGTVEMFAKAGATVAMNDLPGSSTLAEQVARLRAEGFDVIAAPGDMGNLDDVNRMVERAVSAMGGLDYLINNAAAPFTRSSIAPSDLDAQNDEFWGKILNLNLVGPYRAIRAAKKYLADSKGAIVNVASTAAFGGGGSSTAYASSKAALVLMTTELAKGLGPNIRVNGVAPGWVGGTNWDCQWDEEDSKEAVMGIPLQRLGYPEDYAEVIFFFCAGARYVTGQTLLVDGGLMSGF